MRQDLTDITVVLDRSGSMEAVAKDTKGGFDAFVGEQKKAAGDVALTLVQFDTEYEFVHRGKPINQVPPLEFIPRGGTALLDAVGKAITETGERLKAMSEAERPARVVFVIITDGEENSSKEYKRDQVLELIRRQTDAYKWQFVFLGANQDAIHEAAGIGIPAIHAMNYMPTGQSVGVAFAATAKNIRNYADKNDPLAMVYSDNQRADAMKDEVES